jgi:putative ABC transport system permease protein
MNVLADLRFALRQWRKNLLVTIAAVATLALGTGVNTTMFSVIHAVMLKPLPYPHADRLVQVWSTDLDRPATIQEANRITSRTRQLTPPPVVDRWGKASRMFEAFGGYRPWLSNLITPSGDPLRVRATMITEGFFPTLGVSVARGRAFAPNEFVAGHDRVVLLSDALWHSRFQGDPAILGQSVKIDGSPFTIVGILPANIEMLAAQIGVPDIYEPVTNLGGQFERHPSLFVVGRLHDRVTLSDAGDELAAIVQRLGADDPRKGAHGVRLAALREEVAGDLQPALLILLAAAAAVLLIACGNLANLMLANVAARQREIGLRTALGASRGRLVGQLMTESLALSGAGSALGLLLSWWGVRALVQLYPGTIPRMGGFGSEPAVFAFAAGLAMLTALLFGALPALRYSRPDLQQILKDSGQASGGRRSWTGGFLVAGQVATALVLLIGAGLLLRSFLLLRAIPPGFARQHLLIAHLMLDDKNTYRTQEQQAGFVRQLMDHIHTIPGVESAAVTNSLPLDFNLLLSTKFKLEGRPDLGEVYADTRSITDEYFQTLGIGLLQGRFFVAGDASRRDTVLINRTFAHQYFGEANPIGRHLIFGTDGEPRARVIAGVVADVRNYKIERNTVAELYMPFENLAGPFLDVAIRATGDPLALGASVREELRKVDPNQPLGTIGTMEAVLDKSVAKPRWYATLVGSFAALALFLAAMGIYGVVAYSVSRRTKEIGIRMAIGAERAAVMRMVIRESMIPALCGVAAGVPLAIAASRVLTTFLYGVELLDARTYIIVALLVPTIALAAAYFPARRAMGVDPLVALRHD